MRGNRLFGVMLIAYALYAAFFISRTSFVIDGERYFCLFDDAMISMQYAKNLAEGHGLVWNAGGERVEGFTNPLWVVWMALFHLLPVSPNVISLFVQVSGAVFIMLTLIVVRRIGERISGGDTFIPLAGVALTAFYLPLNNWSLQGMEVSVLTLVTSVALWQALRSIEKSEAPPWLYLLLGFSTLIRIDMVVPFVTIMGFLALADSPNRKRHLFLGVSALLLFLGAQTGLRLLYYGEFLPNTYYLKVAGHPLDLRLLRGLHMFSRFASGIGWLLFAVPLVLAFVRRDMRLILLLLAFLGQVCYSISVGGDAWEWWGGSNRYVAVVMPCFFVLFTVGVVQGVSFLIRDVWQKAWAMRYAISISAVVLLVSLVRFNAIYSSASAGDWWEFGTWLVSGERSEETSRERGVDWWEIAEWLVLTRPLDVADNADRVRIARYIRSITTPHARVAVAAAGATPYFAERPAIDLLGKNDKVVARGPMRPSFDTRDRLTFAPGHSKWNYHHSLGSLRPDVIAQMWFAAEEAEPYLREYTRVPFRDTFLYLRTASAEILWEKVRHVE